VGRGEDPEEFGTICGTWLEVRRIDRATALHTGVLRIRPAGREHGGETDAHMLGGEGCLAIQAPGSTRIPPSCPWA
jgi:hypothetical protein